MIQVAASWTRSIRSLKVAAAGAAVAALAACAPCIKSHPVEAQSQVALASSAQDPALKAQIDAIIQQQLLPYIGASIKVYSLQRGETLYEYNSRLLQTPASNQKLFTAAAALKILGKDKKIATTVSVDPAGSVIYLKGCGDSMLTDGDLAKLAESAAAKVDLSREYTVRADLSCFDDIPWGKGWMWDDEPEPDEMYITPLSVNLNTVAVRVSPAKTAGGPALVQISPQSSLVKVVNSAVTVPSKQKAAVKVERPSGDRDNVITVSGVIPAGSDPVHKRLTVWKPEEVALGLFADHLRSHGVSVTTAGNAASPTGAEVIAQKERTVGDLVRYALKQSDNLSAENLLKLTALAKTGQPGSAGAGATAVRGFLQEKGIGVEKLVIVDGSGVSRYNLTNSDTIVSLLEQVYRDGTIYPAFYDSLPIAGKDGTLAARMKGTPAEGKVRGKTGTMSGISALSGYLQTADGEPLAYSILIENFSGPARPAREVQDRIVLLLSRFRR